MKVQIVFFISISLLNLVYSDGAIVQSLTRLYHLFNQTDQTFINITVPEKHGFPCKFANSDDTKFTCAYLSHENSVVVGVDYCSAVLNLTSFNWILNSTSKMEYLNGVIFNHDEAREAAIYIGTKGINGSSAVYQV